jgi:hypothetical protein
MNPLQASLAGSENVFVAKLNPAGSALVYSTYLGGSVVDIGTSIAVDSSGNAYVTGATYSSNFPTTSGAYQTAMPYVGADCAVPSGGGLTNTCLGSTQGCTSGFAVKINPVGSGTVYSTYLGGTCSAVRGNSIAVDSSGNAYLAGYANPAGVYEGGGYGNGYFPTTAGAFQTTPAGDACSTAQLVPCEDAFVTKLDPTGSTLLYSTLLGGAGNESVNGIAIDTSGNAYVTGFTSSTNFPTANAIQASLKGTDNAFVSKLNAEGSALVYSTYLGGNGLDDGLGIALGSLDNAYITGYTTSSNFPIASTQGYLAAPGATNVFASKLNGAGNALIASGYLGGSISDYGRAIALDASGSAYLTGYTNSIDFPVTKGAFQTEAAPKSCAIYPAGYVPFTQITSSAFGSFSSGISSGYVVVGYGTPAALSGLSNIPLPNSSNGQGFCSEAELTPNIYYGAWVPTAAMRNGDFSSFSGALIDPYTGTAFPGNIIPGALWGGVFAWPVGAPVIASPDAFVTKITGLALPVAFVTPGTLSFGNQIVETSSSAQTVTLTNRGDAALAISSIATGGGFSQNNTCGITLSAGASCGIGVTFKPTAAGTVTSALIISDNAAGSPQTVALSGTGLVMTSGPNPPVAPSRPASPRPGH